MAQAARVGDAAVGAGGGPAVEAAEGSPDVFINGRAALRADDAAGTDWQAIGGSRGILVNGMPAMRAGDATSHGGDAGQVADGSPDVELGDLGGGTPKERPHDRALTIDFVDALGRTIDEVTVDVFCPHQPGQRTTVDGKTTASGLCTSSTVSVHKGLAGGTWDPNAVQGSHAQSHHVVTDPVTGGAQAPDEDGPKPSGKKVVHAPAPAGTPPGQQSVHVVRPNGGTTVQLTTVHNWVELVYKAFGHELPTKQHELALLGVREASLAGAGSRDHLEAEAGWGDYGDVDYTREHKAAAYNDLIFAAYTDKHVKTKQLVEVFECTIDASPSKAKLHLPFLQEGHLFHCKPGPFHSHNYPGHDISLHVFNGKKPPKPEGHGTAEEVLAIAHKKIGYLETPDNHTIFNDWFGPYMDGQPWCAAFVSWCMHHAGLDEIKYTYCPTGWAEFQSGAWGTFHSRSSKCEPGDIVFFQWDSDPRHSHTGLIVKDDGDWFYSIEGNTEKQDMSNPNGGGVHPRHRPKNGQVVGFGRPRYKKAETVETSVIRWGGEGAKVLGQYARGNTLLHHHYFEGPDHHKKVDPKAARYRRFMHLYREAKNIHAIPYLIVSSHYVKSYAEWVAWVDENPGKVAPAASVLRPEGLATPHGVHGLYVPSYFTKSYAERVLEHAAKMHDRHKAHELVDELKAALLHVHAPLPK